ncbi:HAMP domain-containing histidine kinase [Streptomyces sp. M600PL45_2]|uniref:histidine kinase n=1 Tax=Streptomyces marispadix TaxID=2922868 RepID=A0ABS9T2C6_9ACTN|nr:HAMP domain-containing sensor histidine kinase [Streptomyces marispadix]MCH6162689.1 HAMP domain-containing histidine kinase [Streptomyces marispadix]
MRRGSVRTRAALGATLVVAVALVAAGFAVVAVLRDGLAGNAKLQAESTARGVAAEVSDVDARGVRRLDGLDTDDEPAQVVGPRGKVLGASEGLRGRGPVAGFNRVEEDGTPEPDRSTGDDGDDSGTGEDSGATGDEHQNRDRDRHRNRGGDDSGPGSGSGSGEDNSGHGSGSGSGEDNSGHGSDDDAREDDSPEDDSPEDDDGDAPATTPSATPGDDTEVDRDSEQQTVKLNGQDFTLVGVQSRTRDGTPVTVYAGASLKDQQEAVSSVTQAMLVGLPALLLVVGGVTWLVTRRALRPVESIRGEMAGIMASADLSRRVPEPDARDEVARLARTTNDTLAALESSVERQRRFVADVSHELRSPIASLRTQLEVGAAHPDLLDVDGAVQDTVRLQQLATDLLLLARLDAGERPGEGRVALGALAREELAQQQGPHPVRLGTMADGEVTGSRAQLARVVINLLQNAQRHASSEVHLSVRESHDGDGPWVELEVSDDGPGVPEAERERIFERFVRLDDARSRDEGGAGLGLAIARDVATRHGGTLSVRAGSRFVLRLPAAQSRERERRTEEET